MRYAALSRITSINELKNDVKNLTLDPKAIKRFEQFLLDFQSQMAKHFTALANAVRGALARLRRDAVRPMGPYSMPYTNAVIARLCNDDPATIEWVLRWIAYPLRNPSAKMSTALWVAGGRGTGKGFIFYNLFGAIHGPAATSISSSAIESVFNNWASEKRLVIVEDFALTAKNQVEVKNLITAYSVIIETKARASRIEDNQMNFVFLSGDVDALNVAAGNRRFMTLKPGKRLPQEFYSAAIDEIQRGGIEQFYQFLMLQLDMRDFNAHTLSMSAQKVCQ